MNKTHETLEDIVREQTERVLQVALDTINQSIEYARIMHARNITIAGYHEDRKRILSMVLRPMNYTQALECLRFSESLCQRMFEAVMDDVQQDCDDDDE